MDVITRRGEGGEVWTGGPLGSPGVGRGFFHQLIRQGESKSASHLSSFAGAQDDKWEAVQDKKRMFS